MTFTDDDLKRLIEIKNKGIKMSDAEAIEFNRLWMKNPRALLSRLEAAEKVVSLVVQYTLIADQVVPIGEAVEAWRKAAGK